jgi:hypothetical protein
MRNSGSRVRYFNCVPYQGNVQRRGGTETMIVLTNSSMALVANSYNGNISHWFYVCCQEGTAGTAGNNTLDVSVK